jgi:hypothetical protein
MVSIYLEQIFGAFVPIIFLSVKINRGARLCRVEASYTSQFEHCMCDHGMVDPPTLLLGMTGLSAPSTWSSFDALKHRVTSSSC